jgi:hypothetical protein
MIISEQVQNFAKRTLATITDQMKDLIKGAVKHMNGKHRRVYMAEVTLELLDGNARQAERVFGWGRGTVKKGLRERATGIVCHDHYAGRGNRKTEEKCPQLEADIRALVDPVSQADPKFQTPFAYTRITAQAVRQALIDEKGYSERALPCEKTIGNILNRLDYRLKRIQKIKPLKKIPETDAIFANIADVTRQLQVNLSQYRLSIDTKAKLPIGNFSRHGKTRVANPDPALDHDFEPEEKLVPVGILEPEPDRLTIFYSTSIETSDLIVDCLDLWWDENRSRLLHVSELILNLDNGPHVQSRRRQFIKRLVEFADKTGLSLRLIYYPPYHSKYNPIERCWGILEQHWNGTLLNSVHKVIEWTKRMTWNGVRPVVHLFKKAYKKGMTLTDDEMDAYEARLDRSKTLPKWDVMIQPVLG